MNSFVVGFMFGVIALGAVWLNGNTPLIPFAPTSSSDSVTKPVSQIQSGAVSIADQPAGSSVVVESVTVPPPGVWVAVREMGGNTIGNVLGAVRASGPRSALTISLLRATEPNSPYAIELYRDDGNDTFDLATDSVYVDFATGLPVIAYFTTTN